MRVASIYSAHSYSQSMRFGQARHFYHDELEPALSISVSLQMNELNILYLLIVSIWMVF